MTPDGSVFDLSGAAKAEPTIAGESPETGSLATPKGSAFAISIADDRINVNSNEAATAAENSLLMHYLYAVADIGDGPVVLKLHIEEMYDPGNKQTNKRAYALHNIEKAFGASVRVQGNSLSSLTNTQNAINTVADLFAAVKSHDSKLLPTLTGKIVNADGTPKVMYL